MKELIFATTNPGKVASLQLRFDAIGYEVTVVAQQLDIVEIQADTALEVARAKAREAFERLGHPVVVDDSELCIEALGGFPGPYQKYMTQKLGPDGLVRLMQGYDDRRAYFISNLVFVDADGAQHEFSDDPYRGVIGEEVDSTDQAGSWGPLGKIFIPEGLTVTLSKLTAQERQAYDAGRTAADAYVKFAEWYAAR